MLSAFLRLPPRVTVVILIAALGFVIYHLATAGRIQPVWIVVVLVLAFALARSGCGIMLQESGVPLTLTVRETISLFRTYYPRPLPLARVIAMAGLAEKTDARVGTLSGGQRQRLYFALAVCGDPDMLCLDEPTAGLDVEARHRHTARHTARRRCRYQRQCGIGPQPSA